MKIFSFVIFIFIFSYTIVAQLPVQFEEKYFPKQRRNIVYKTLITKDSAYLAVGEKESIIGYDQDLAIIKINKNGEEEWRIIYDDKLDWACGFDVKEFENGDLIILGEIAKGFNSDKKDLILFKVTSDGEVIWRKKHALRLTNILRHIQISKPEKIILIGEEESNENFYFLVLNNEGSFMHEFYINKKMLLLFY